MPRTGGSGGGGGQPHRNWSSSWACVTSTWLFLWRSHALEEMEAGGEVVTMLNKASLGTGSQGIAGVLCNLSSK